ncbi:MAG: hypothetical protein HRT44_10060 [Bdellovibrionales bacterium]|nr:hypothetical protein [Bdellovibrionales bacterium]NQZ19584.1 hypothetical protein [Bdellovibrionales bacterium]
MEKSFDNFSLDLLFSLPQQNLEGVYSDLQVIKKVNPPHVSAYNLTVAENHPMNQNRVSDDEQVKMFHMIDGELEDIGQYRYEISNFSRPHFESVHNNIYWTDHSYWALGLSAHGYFKNPDYGYRFWNPSTYKTYLQHIETLKEEVPLEDSFPHSQFEKLRFQDSLTDFCHTHMRLMNGLNETSLRQKFGDQAVSQVSGRMEELTERSWVEKSGENWKLTSEGLLLSNQVFAKLLFSADNIDNS